MLAKLLYKTCGLMILAIIVAAGLWLTPPLPQDLQYHHFVDVKMLFGIPNALNVLTNIPFLIVGILGLVHVIKVKSHYNLFYVLFFFGVFWVFAGSSYYHLHPDNARLAWDRLPMTIAFMAFFSAIIAERISLKAAKLLLLPLLLLGAFSVGYWHHTETLGRGDLRLYVFVQFLPIIAIPYILTVFTGQYTATHYVWLALFAYACAKLCGFYDQPIYALSHQIISGHSIKHLLAALATYAIYRYYLHHSQYRTAQCK